MTDQMTPDEMRREATRLRLVADLNGARGWENNAESCRRGADALDRLAAILIRDKERAAEFDRMIEVVKAEARAEERKRLAREIRAEAIGPREGDLATTYIWYAGRRAGLQWAETIVCGQREDT